MMQLSRRTFLRLAGVTALATPAGCARVATCRGLASRTLDSQTA